MNGEKYIKNINIYNKKSNKKIIKKEEIISENNNDNKVKSERNNCIPIKIISDIIDKKDITIENNNRAIEDNITIDKSIILNNKRVRDSLINKGKSLRNETKDLEDIYLTYDKQIQLLNEYYLNDDCENSKLLRSELIKKINSYKNQDLCKNLYNFNTIISLNEVVEKLVSSKLKCHYCLKNVLLFYKNVRDEFQWTLDRINNDKEHSNDNTIIACLKCNVQRRRRDKDVFLFSKQLKINKNY